MDADHADNVEEEQTTDVVNDESENDSGIGSSGGGSSSNTSETSESYQTCVDELERLTEELEINDDELDKALEDRVEVIITTENDNLITLTMDKTATINDVLNQAALLNDQITQDDVYDLSIDGKVLQRGITLRDAAILHGSRLRMVEGQIQIFIRRVDGRTITMDTHRSDTIESLKDQFFYTDQVPVHQQRLLFQSVELENTRTLKSYNIRNGSTLEMVYRLRGGSH